MNQSAHIGSSAIEASVIKVPAQNNILHFTADLIFEKFSHQAADFSNLTILLPHSQATQQLNQALSQQLDAKMPAIIPPWAGTLRSWTQQFSHNQHAEYQIISEHARQLLFIEALQQHPDLFKEENKWQVTQALLNFFDELSLNQMHLFSSAEEWQQQLQHAYGIEQQNQHLQLEHLQHESKLVFTLWHAWQQQLSENQLYDETGDYLSRLKVAVSNLADSDIAASQKIKQQFICVDLSQYTKTELDFINALISRNQCLILEHENTMLHETEAEAASAATDENSTADNAFAAFIKQTFSASPLSIKDRAEKFANDFSADLPFSVYTAADEEEQIRAIDYAVRSAIISGKNSIAIVSEDRKLSRRLRALLERANIQLQDNAGWSLATTQAATIIDRWLECIEEDFSAYPLLDCLKSPYINIANDVSASNSNSKPAPDSSSSFEYDYRQNVYRFEHDLIFHENVSSNISQYKIQLKRRLNRLTHWPQNSYNELIKTLDYIDDCSKPLSKIHAKDKNIKLADFLSSLTDSLEKLGVLRCYQSDEAGLLLLETLAALKQSTKHANPLLNWQDCRIWLGMALESQNFTPPKNNSGVQLMTLEQTSCLHFDSIIIAAVETKHFPGSAKLSPFFNQAVRTSLGLSSWKEQREQRHELFNRTLLSSAEILLTACDEEKGEEKPVSPWLELLINFYQLAYDKKPFNHYLQQLVESSSEVFNCDDSRLPEPARQPAPEIPEGLIPQRVSASSYQRLINCPYQYFGADGLRLKPLEELSDELKKSDYGERIHLILQVFHNGHDRYGKAFTQTLTAGNRNDAEAYLTELSEKIFFADMTDNVLHRSWLYRWKKHIPAYISWQIQQQSDWHFYLSEKSLETDLDISDTESIKIVGRIDRIDNSNENNTHAIIDYKTGKTAKQDDVDAGENVQLSTYALLDPEASEVTYLSVDSSSQRVESKSSLSGENLEFNRIENNQRLIEIFKQMKNHQPLPAWGDDLACRFCNFSGLCRKAEWKE